MQPTETIWTMLVADLPGIIPVGFGQIPIRGLEEEVVLDPRAIIWTTLVEDL